MATPKRIFISYTHDSDDHKDRVLALATQLVEDGLDVELDQWLAVPVQGWPQWMTDEITASDYVLVVCTETYLRRFNGKEKPGLGLGATWEGATITGELYKSQGRNTKFIPVLLSGAQTEWIPSPLRATSYYRLDIPEDYVTLYRRLTDQPAVQKPKLGTIKSYESREPPKLFSDLAPTPKPEPTPDKPSWFIDSGTDNYGQWATFEVRNVRQKMRWIEPGTFWMGSPEGEKGRRDDEGPRHHVELTQGFWLGETPCTQALWKAVMGDNPSHFKGVDRPVEQVNWDDCQQFLRTLGKKVPGLDPTLPTEAQWEYACRAGTETPRWHASLDSIAWFRENSGDQTPVFKWLGVDNKKSHPVSRKLINPWGLYDILGNVLEWCSDGKRLYSAEDAIDPMGPEDPKRITRGGSWNGYAEAARAACRGMWETGFRSYVIGFRLARSAE